MKKILLASNNPGKIREIAGILSEYNIEVLPQASLAIPEVEENGLSFVENAIIKARHAAQQSGLPSIADDSGLEVDFLGGEPGIYSARFAGTNANDTANNEKLLNRLEGVPWEQRQGRFRCVMVFMRHPRDPSPLITQGTWEGMILTQPRGAEGFGYDPLFYLPDRGCSSAELDATEKNRLSHRSQALRQLADQFARGRVRGVPGANHT